MRMKTSTSSARTLRSLMPGIMTVGLGYRPIHARSPHLGTVAGAVLALGIDLLLPGWALVATLAMLMVATVAYAFLGDYARQVMVMTPMIVLLGAGNSSGRAEVAAERVLATLLGAVIAAGIALALARYEREYPATQPWASPGGVRFRIRLADHRSDRVRVLRPPSRWIRLPLPADRSPLLRQPSMG